MACRPCQEAQRQFFTAARRLDTRGAIVAAKRGVAIAADKARGVDVDAKYGLPPQPTFRSPYRSPWKRP